VGDPLITAGILPEIPEPVYKEVGKTVADILVMCRRNTSSVCTFTP